MGVEVRAPDGRVWTVRRRWWYSPRWRLREYELPEGSAVEAEPLFPMVAPLTVIVILGALALLVFSVVAVLVELVVAAVGILALRKPWIVIAEAQGPAPARREWRVHGRWQSEEAVKTIARKLASGHPAGPGAPPVARPRDPGPRIRDRMRQLVRRWRLTAIAVPALLVAGFVGTREVWLAVGGAAVIGVGAAIADAMVWAELTDPEDDEV